VQSSCITLPSGETVCPSSFPMNVNYGFMWNTSAAFEMAAITSTETRALWLLGATEASPWSGMPHVGLDCWSPNINMNHDPR
jgi:beta-glucosidase-like glycosyl hydrolase